MKHTAPFAFCIAMMIGWGVAPNAFGQTVAPADDTPDGLSTNDWSSIRAAYDTGRHAVHADEDGYRAHNPGQQWTTHFDGRSFLTEPDAGGWTWGLKLLRYGFMENEREVSTPLHVSTDGQNITYDWDENLQEWYVNDSRGLEHGYTVHQRPTKGEGPLTFTLAIRGELRPEVTGDGRGARFVNEDRATVLTYSGLTVLDADGKELAAYLVSVSGRLLLSVDDQYAQYPLTIDPLVQQAYLKASNPDVDDFFGDSVAVSGNTVLVGARQEDSNATGVNGDESDNSMTEAGAAYVFVRNGTTWSQQAYLKASNTDKDDKFGSAVAVSDDTAVVGASWEDGGSTGVNGDQSDQSASRAGGVYVFVRNGTTWSQQAYLKASNTESGDYFGVAVTISGDTIVVGAVGEDSDATGVNGDQTDNSVTDAGAAYVFTRNGTTWTQQAYLKTSNPDATDQFGRAIAASGNTVVVGAYAEDSHATGVNGNESDNSALSSGAAYVFVRNGTTWSQQAYLKASNPDAMDFFGIAVAASGDTVVVGAPNEDSDANGVNGDSTDNSVTDAGAAYVFVRNGTSWSQQAYLKASNSDGNHVIGTFITGDTFGHYHRVAIDGDTIVVGAAGESSNATGVNGDQSDNSQNFAGAAYVFVRNGTTWSQQAYLKASNTEKSESFGFSAGVSGNTVVLGAPYEDSGDAGVNGDQSDNSTERAGAAYIFHPLSFFSYGTGCPGTGGIVPELVVSGSATPGGQIQVDLTNGVGGGSTMIFVGTQQLSVPTGFGCSLFVGPLPLEIFGPVPLFPIGAQGPGAGSLSLNTTFPPWVQTPFTFTIQAFIIDPGGNGGYSNTNGVEINVQ